MAAPALSERVTFGDVTTADFEDVLKLRIAAMQESLERLDRFDPARARERLQKSFYPEHSQFILLNGLRAGFYTLRPVGDDLHLDHFYIDPRCQSQGIGSHVLRHLFAHADARGLPIRLGALRGSRSNVFYQRHGFVQTTEDEFDIYYQRLPQVAG